MHDVFQAGVLPRPAVGRAGLTRWLVRTLWRVWRLGGNRPRRRPQREARLAAFGPLAIFAMFTSWAVGFIAGYSLIYDGLRTGFHPVETSFGASLYTSATTFVPLSYGDVVPTGVATRVATVLESGTGIILGALVITLLFSLYGSFQAREELVITLDALAGAPPSGLQILEAAADHRTRDDLSGTFAEWRQWAAAVLESHLAYPVLVYFRSSHDNEAWLNSFGAIMDAAALIVSAVKDDSEGSARLMLTVGNHLVDDFSGFFGLRRSTEPYVEREEFDQALTRLKTAGYSCQGETPAWDEFAGLRARYAGPLGQLSRFLDIVPAQWAGDRSYLPHTRGRGTATVDAPRAGRTS